MAASARRLWHSRWSRVEIRLLQWSSVHGALSEALGPTWTFSDTERFLLAGAIRVPGRGLLLRDLALPPGTHITAHLRPTHFPAISMRSDPKRLAVHVDESVVVFDKPVALPTVSTADNGLQHVVAFAKEKEIVPRGSPLLVTSRLDAGTHGLLVFARTSAAQVAYNDALFQRKVSKRYEAVVTPRRSDPEALYAGELLTHWLSDPEVRNRSESDVIETLSSPRMNASLVEHEPKRGGVRTSKEQTKDCPQRAELIIEHSEPLKGMAASRLASLRPLRPWPSASLAEIAAIPQAQLLRIQLLTGRTHQIRAQLHACGWALLGDELYDCPHTVFHAPDYINSWALACSHLGFNILGRDYDIVLPEPPEE